jgi:hypothetical protein
MVGYFAFWALPAVARYARACTALIVRVTGRIDVLRRMLLTALKNRDVAGVVATDLPPVRADQWGFARLALYDKVFGDVSPAQTRSGDVGAIAPEIPRRRATQRR